MDRAAKIRLYDAMTLSKRCTGEYCSKRKKADGRFVKPVHRLPMITVSYLPASFRPFSPTI